jgi:hypothetical protein
MSKLNREVEDGETKLTGKKMLASTKKKKID